MSGAGLHSVSAGKVEACGNGASSPTHPVSTEPVTTQLWHSRSRHQDGDNLRAYPAPAASATQAPSLPAGRMLWAGLGRGGGGGGLSTQGCHCSGCHAVHAPQPWKLWGWGKCGLAPLPPLACRRAGQLWPLAIALARADQPRCSPTGLKASVLGPCRQQFGSTMLMAMWGGAHSHAAGGAGAAGQGRGAGGEHWPPSTSERGCPGSHEAAGPLRKGWRVAVHGPTCQDTLCPSPAWGGPKLLNTPGNRWLAFPAGWKARCRRMRLSLAALFPSWMSAVGQGVPAGIRGLPAAGTSSGLVHASGFWGRGSVQREKIFVATKAAILQDIFLAGFAATSGAGAWLGERVLVLFGSRTTGLPGKGQDGAAFLRAACEQRPRSSAPLIAVAYLVSAARRGLILIRGEDKRPRVLCAREPGSGWHWPLCLGLVP